MSKKTFSRPKSLSFYNYLHFFQEKLFQRNYKTKVSFLLKNLTSYNLLFHLTSIQENQRVHIFRCPVLAKKFELT